MNKMQKETLKGSTSDQGELVIDYKNNKTDIKGVPEDSLDIRLRAGFMSWFSLFFLPFIILWVLGEGIYFSLTKQEIFTMHMFVFWVAFVFILCLTLLHLDFDFDRRAKRFFAKRSGQGKRSVVTVKQIKDKEFVVFDIQNMIVDWKVTGEFSKYISKVWIKEEHISSMLSRQGLIKNLFYTENRNIWNAHFLFDKIPKKGELHIEWI